MPPAAAQLPGGRRAADRETEDRATDGRSKSGRQVDDRRLIRDSQTGDRQMRGRPVDRVMDGQKGEQIDGL